MRPAPATPRATELLTARERASIRAPIEQARTLPRRAFTCAAFHRAELERVFWRNWAGVCFSMELPHPGSVRVLDAFGLPIVLTRADDGQLRGFHNVCPYDSAPVALADRTGAETLDSPYHGWRYDLTGSLVDAPYWAGPPGNAAGRVPPEGRHLVEVAVGEAIGIVFVNIDGAAGPLDDHVAGTRSVLAEYDVDLATATGDRRRPFRGAVEANWKTIAENDCLNILHESFVHELYRRSPEVPRVNPDGTPRFEVVDEPNVIGFSYLVSDTRRTYPAVDLPHLGNGREPRRGYFLQHYPNVAIAAFEAVLAPAILLPDGPASTLVTGTQFIHPDTDVDTLGDIVERTGSALSDAAAEDRAIVEAVQRSRRSIAVDQCFYAPFWDEPHYRFTNRVLDDLEVA